MRNEDVKTGRTLGRQQESQCQRGKRGCLGQLRVKRVLQTHNKTESGDNSIRTEWESCHGVYSATPFSYLFTFSGAKSREQQLTICKSFKGKRETSAVVAAESRDRQQRQHHKGIKWVPPQQITKPVDTQENNNRFRGCFLPPAPYLKALFSPLFIWIVLCDIKMYRCRLKKKDLRDLV